jgi:hypothetical protein
LISILILLIGLSSASRVDASPDTKPEFQPTPFLTPTPGPDGRIVYIVQPGDNFWSIAAIAGISLEELYALNGIQPGDFAIEGMELVLGLGGPVEPTEVPAPVNSPTPEQPTPLPEFNTGEICVLLFNDTNGNARVEEDEEPLEGGQVSIVDVEGNLAAEVTTGDDPEGYCFEGLTAGDYNVSAAVPIEYNPTTTMSSPLRLRAGDIQYVQFGAQPSAALSDKDSGSEGGQSLLYGVFGILLLLSAGGLAYYASRYRRKKPLLHD